MHIEAVIKRFKEINGLSKHKELAKFLNISPQDFSQRKNRGTIINLLLEHPSTKQINLHWLLTGEGPMKIEEPQKAVAVASAEPIRKNYADILRMTAEVMESGSIYAKALQSNVLAFHRAVTREALPADTANLDQRLKQLESELRVIKESGGPPGERSSDSSRKEGAASDQPPEGPELGKMGM